MLPCILTGYIDKDIIAYVSEKALELDIPSHACFHIYPQAQELVIEQIRELKDLLQSLRGTRAVVVVHKCDTASAVVQNALLKSLEEQSSTVQFVLVCADETQLLPTVLSRCVMQWSQRSGQSADGHELPDLHAMTYAQWLQATSGLDKQGAIDYLDTVIRACRKRLLQFPEEERSISLLHSLIDIRRGLHNHNVNYEYALDAAGYHIKYANILKP